MRWILVSPVGLPGLAVIGVGFVIFIVTLLLARRRREPEAPGVGRRDTASRLGIVVQGVGIGATGFGRIEVVLDPLGGAAIAQAALVAVLMGSAIGLFFASSRAMGRNWAIVAQTRSDHQLVTAGPFAHVRNPIYVAMFLFMLALTAAYGHWRNLVVGVPLFAIGTMMRVRIEERLLRAQFGAAYDDYAALVKRFVPGVI